MSRRTVTFAVAALAVAGVAALAWRLSRTPPTDEELVRAVFVDAARAAEEKRIGDAVAAVSERFSAGGLDRRGVKQLVAFHVLRGDWVSVSVTEPRVRIEGDTARANVDAVLARGGKGAPLSALVPSQASVHRFSCRLAREPEGWKIVEATWRPVELAEALAGPPDPAPGN